MALRYTEKELHKEFTIEIRKNNTKIIQLLSIKEKIMSNNIKLNHTNHLKNLSNYKTKTIQHK